MIKSQEVNTRFIIAAATVVLITFSIGMANGVSSMLRGLIANSYQIRAYGPVLQLLFEKIGGELLATVVVSFLLLILVAFAGNMIQHRMVWSFEVMTPKLSKSSLTSGLKRLFSKRAQ